MRVKVRLMQRFFIPPSLATGFMGLALGPGGGAVLPLSTNMETYAAMLIAFISSAPAFTSRSGEEQGASVGQMWVYC